MIVAFFGGIDSCLITYLARKYLGMDKTLAIISKSSSLIQKDLKLTVDFCMQLDINLEIIETKEFENPNYISNPINICYICKVSLYDE